MSGPSPDARPVPMAWRTLDDDERRRRIAAGIELAADRAPRSTSDWREIAYVVGVPVVQLRHHVEAGGYVPPQPRRASSDKGPRLRIQGRGLQNRETTMKVMVSTERRRRGAVPVTLPVIAAGADRGGDGS